MATENRVTIEQIHNKIVDKTFFFYKTLTICVLELANGFTVTGESACVDPANYDKKKGEQLAFEDAFEKIWPLEGYLLQEKLHAVPQN